MGRVTFLVNSEKHGGGVCCDFAPQLVLLVIRYLKILDPETGLQALRTFFLLLLFLFLCLFLLLLSDFPFPKDLLFLNRS